MNSPLASRLRGNRKGIAIDEAVPAIVFIICSAFVLFAFLIFHSVPAKQQQQDISSDISASSAERDLTRALTLPLDGVPLGKAIVDADYGKGELKPIADAFAATFSSSNPYGWTIVAMNSGTTIFFSTDGSRIVKGGTIPTGQSSIQEIASAQLPLLGDDGALTLTLYSLGPNLVMAP